MSPPSTSVLRSGRSLYKYAFVWFSLSAAVLDPAEKHKYAVIEDSIFCPPKATGRRNIRSQEGEPQATAKQKGSVHKVSDTRSQRCSKNTTLFGYFPPQVAME